MLTKISFSFVEILPEHLRTSYPWRNVGVYSTQNSSVKVSHTYSVNNLVPKTETNTSSDVNCIYKSASTWSACNPITETRTLTRMLDSESPMECPKNITESRPCFTRSGKGMLITERFYCRL